MNAKQKDDFGNKMEYIERNDGTTIRITQTNRNKQFYVFGDVYSKGILLKNTVLKTYYDDYHYQAINLQNI